MRRKTYLIGASVSLALASFLLAQVPVPVETDFESSEGYSPGPLPDSAQWTVGTSGAEVTDTDSHSGLQSILFPGTSSYLTGSYLNSYPDEITFLDFYIRPVTGPLESLPLEPSAPPTSFMVGFIEDSSGGSFYVTNGDGQSGGEWLPVSDAFATTGGKTDEWVRTTYRINYATKTWDLYLNSVMVAADLGFLDDELDRFTQLRMRGGNQGAAGFDFYYLGFTNPLFTDLDRDGIADDYEEANGMDTTQDDRGGDADHDTLTNLQEYFSGLKAGSPDSDLDGVHDGMDEDPSVAGSYALSAIPFTEDFEALSLGMLDGTNLWESTGAGAVVQSGVAAEGTQALAVTSGAAALKVSNEFNGSGDTKIWVKFQLRPTVWATGTYPQASDLSSDGTAVFIFQEGGKVAGFDGNGSGGGQWTSVDLGLIEDSWVNVALFEDYETQTWSLWIDNAPAFSGMGFAHAQPYFHRFALKQINSNPAYLDDFSARYTDSVELDSDGDGLLDSEEDANGNGYVDLGETDPNNPDTDGDGINDQAGVLMRLWLRADTGVTTDSNGKVAAWADARGTGDAAQASGSLQPILVEDVLAGQPAVRFDGVDDYLSGLSDFDPSGGDFTFIVVQQKNGGHDKAAPLSYNVGAVSGAPLIRWGPEIGQLGINDVDVGPNGLYVELGPDHEGKPYVTTFCREGDTLSVRALGPGQTERATGTQTWTSGGDGHFYLGKKKDSADHPFGGDILEVRVYQGALSEADFLKMESELAERYGVEIDLDDDGLLDSFERLYFTDLDEVGSGDYDGDGITNLREQNLGLNPTIADAPTGILGHANLKLWLSADSGLNLDSGKVTAWEDISGNGEIAYQDVTGNQPSLVASGLNGQPAVAFDGVDDYLEALSAFNASASDFTMIVVQNRTGGHDKAAVLSYSTDALATGAPLLRWGPNPGQFGINDVGVSDSGVYVDPGADYLGQTYVSTVTRTGGTSGLGGSLFVRQSGNGLTEEATGTQGWTSEDTDGFYIARKKVTEDHYFGGEIAQVLVFDTALSQAEIEVIEADLIAQYGVDADLDRDGLSDAWEMQYFGSLAQNGAGDFDGDGVSNYREFNLGTIPNQDDNFHFVMARDDLALWLSAGQGVELDASGKVSSWRDQSGLRHDAVQGTATDRPAWIESNDQHQPAVVFDGIDDYLSGAAGFDPASSDYTVVLVHNRTGGSDKAAPISFSTGSSDNGAPLLRWGPNAGQFGINNVGVSATGVYVELGSADESNLYLSTVRSAGNNLTLTMAREGETYTSTGTRTWATHTSSGYFLGKKQLSSSDMLGGEIAEVLVFSSALSDTDLAKIETCLINKYGLSNDRDHDGLTNDQEDLNGNGLVNAGETDPWNPDSDGDGILDSLDFAWEADPANPAHVASLTDVDGYLTWSTSFESSEGYSAGALGGQNYWTASRIVNITNTDASEGTQALSLTPPTVEGASVAERLVDGSAAPKIWVSFDAKLAVGRLPKPSEITGTPAALFAVTYSGTVAAFDVETQQWIYAPGAVESDTWAHYDLYLDYPAKSWKLFVNGEFVFDNLPFIDPGHTALERFKAWQVGEGVAGLLDNLSITQKPPAGDIDEDGLDNALEFALGSNLFSSDSDGDEIPDLWEYTYGLQINVPDADQDNDEDGLTNAEEYAFGTDPTKPNTDNDDYSDFLETRLFASDPLNPDASGTYEIASDFILSDINASDSVAYQSGIEEGVYYVGGYGTGLAESSDSGHLFHQSVVGNFKVSLRIDRVDPELEGSNVVLMARESASPDAAFAGVLSLSNTRWYSLVSRLASAEAYGEVQIRLTNEGERWIRLERQGDQFTASASQDGVNWLVVSTKEVDLSDSVDVGMFYASGAEDQFMAVQFTLSQWLTDADRDGLWDQEEVLLGTLIGTPDSDGDGYSDYEEVYIFFTDPLVPDLGTAIVLSTTAGSAGVSGLGQWVTDGNSVYATTIKGKLTYTINVPTDGVYRLEFEAQSRYNSTVSNVFPVEVSIDGQFIDRVNAVLLGDGSIALIQVTTPWILEGSHEVELFYDNSLSGRQLQINALRLVEIPGPDNNSNGIADWVEHRLSQLNELDESGSGPVASFVSPYQVEGYTRFFDSFNLTVAGQDPLIAHAPGMGWYTDVELSAGATTTIDASFENGALTAQLLVDWTPLNILTDTGPWEEEPLVIRAGESIRLTALPEGLSSADESLISLSLTNLATSVTTTLTIDDSTSHTATVLFDEAGSYSVSGSYDDPVSGLQSDSFTLEVIAGGFNGNPTVGRNVALLWDNPELPGGLPIESDQGLVVSEVGPLVAGGYQLSLSSSNRNDSYIVTRLGAEGTILDGATVHTISVDSNENASYDLLQVYADGSKLIGTSIVIDGLTPNTRVEVEIFVAGVTFDDGTVFKVLTAEDFDEYGRVYLKFIKGATVTNSTCHRIHLYEGDQYLGLF